MIDLDQLTLRPLTRTELDTAVAWAAAEGWNPGLNDADVFWATDPEGFVGAEYQGELVATGSIVAYGKNYGFMGFFIVKPELRGQGIGTRLWFYRRDLLKSRLGPDGAIGMDGVFDMQAWYAKGGFAFSHRNLRMEGIGKSGSIEARIVKLSKLPFSQLAAYDLDCFGCERDSFLEGWIHMPGIHALGYLDDDNLKGYGLIRPCQIGYKIGPLFSDNAEIAESLFQALSNHAAGQPIYLDTPENHLDALALAQRHQMKEVFGCARMYYGKPPAMDWNRIYGITTFELG